MRICLGSYKNLLLVEEKTNMVFSLNKKRVVTNIIILFALMLFLYVLLPNNYALLGATIPLSLMAVSLFKLRESRFYEINNDSLLYRLNDRQVIIPLAALNRIKRHTLFGAGLYTQYFVHFEGYDYELSEDYINQQGKSIVKVLTTDYKLNVETVRGLKLVVKVKKADQ